MQNIFPIIVNILWINVVHSHFKHYLKQIYLTMDGILRVTTTPSGPGSNGKKKSFLILRGYRTVASLPDAVKCHTQDTQKCYNTTW